MDATSAKQAVDTVSSAVNFGIDLREAVFGFFLEAYRFEEDPDGDTNDAGRQRDLTTYHITVGHEALRELVEALEIKVADFGRETPFEALKREMVL